MVCREWGDDAGLAADGDHHHLVGRLQCIDERSRGALRHVQRRAAPGAHAEAAIHSYGDGERKLAGGKGGDRLRRSVLGHAKIRGRESRHCRALLVGDRRVDLHEDDARHKLRVSVRDERQRE